DCKDNSPSPAFKKRKPDVFGISGIVLLIWTQGAIQAAQTLNEINSFQFSVSSPMARHFRTKLGTESLAGGRVPIEADFARSLLGR
ncbi:MAG TPA: hypothetical protein VMV54_00070, partial [Acidocella sp.]|nr:hypothetical protein [Acidocella sp.]